MLFFLFFFFLFFLLLLLLFFMRSSANHAKSWLFHSIFCIIWRRCGRDFLGFSTLSAVFQYIGPTLCVYTGTWIRHAHLVPLSVTNCLLVLFYTQPSVRGVWISFLILGKNPEPCGIRTHNNWLVICITGCLFCPDFEWFFSDFNEQVFFLQSF